MNTESFQLPEALRSQLRSFEHRLRRLESIVAVCGAGAGFLLAWLLLYLSDRIWETPSVLRLAFAIAGMVVFALFIQFWLRRWVFRRRSWRDLARMIQQEHQELGDRLLGVVELTEGRHGGEISPALVRAAIRQVAAEAEKVKFTDAAKGHRSNSYTFLFVGLLIVFGGLLAFNPSAGLNTLERLVKPISDTDRYTFVSLTDVPEQLVVPHGEMFNLRIGIAEDSFRMPGRAEALIGKLKTPLEVEVQDRVAEFQVPAQMEETVLRLRVWDATREIAVIPKFRPAVKELRAFVQYPDYLDGMTLTKRVENGQLKVLEGSQVVLKADLGRELEYATAKVDDVESVWAPTTDGTGFATPPLPVKNDQSFTFRWTDRFGLASLKPYHIQLSTMPDLPPTVELPGQSRYEALLVDESKEIPIQAEDDQGVVEAAIEWQVSDQDGNHLNRSLVHQTILAGGIGKRRLSGSFVFAPSLMKIPPLSIVTMNAVTKDHFPGRKQVKSAEHRFYILSRAEHARLIQERFERIQTQLEELTRAQEKLKAETGELSKFSDDLLKRKHAETRIKELQSAQKKNRQELQGLAQSGLKLLHEALRNKDVSARQLREWAKMIEQMRSIAGKNMQRSNQQLEEARQQQGKRREELQQATNEMDKTVRRMQELLKNLNESMEQLAARNFIQRLEALAKNEDTIKDRMQEILRETIGRSTSELNDTQKFKLKAIVEIVSRVRRDSEELMTDLDHFFSRTQMKKYDDVLQDMRKETLLEKLGEQEKTAEENRGITLMQMSHHWKEKYNTWAKMLGKRDSRRTAGKGGGPTPEELEMMLKMMRLAQEEYNILNQTRGLERRRAFDNAYEEKSKALADRQRDARGSLNELKGTAPQEVHGLLDKAGEAMDDAAELLTKPDTGGPTIAAEMEVIELLTQSLTQCSKSTGDGGSAIAALLMQMLRQMGMSEGLSGGGSLAGGGFDTGKTRVTGDGDGETRDSDVQEKTAGKSLELVPREFRDMLRVYLNEVEELEN